MEDSRIVDLYLSRDESAVKVTQEKYGKKIKGFARHICGNDTAAEECENDTYLGAWNSIPPHEPRSYLYAFLLKITRNLAFDHIKKASRQKRSARIIELSKEAEEILGSGEDVESIVDAKILSQLVSDYLWRQPDEKKMIFMRRYWFMDSLGSIAKRMDISEGKVKTVLFRMRKELKEYLANEGYEI